MSLQSTPILTLTHTLSNTVSARRFVTFAGAHAGANANALGVSRVAGVSGDKIALDVLGTTVVEAGAAITAGATLESDSTGRAVTWATSGAALGIALETAGAAGDFIEVLLLPNAATA